jgi:hypothetical protein
LKASNAFIYVVLVCQKLKINPIQSFETLGTTDTMTQYNISGNLKTSKFLIF